MVNQADKQSQLTDGKTETISLPNRKRVSLIVPGSTSNLGPGFDALGLALTIYSRFTFELSSHDKLCASGITLKGAIAKCLPNDPNNLVYKLLKDNWQQEPELLDQMHITIETDIPLARGLGSSAATTLATLYAIELLSGRTPNKNNLLACATLIEGHPDNIAASLMGGLVISAQSEKPNCIVAQKLSWPSQWRTIIVVPGYELSTKKAREVLAKQIPLADAVYNIQKTALLLAAVANQDDEALAEALHDKLHQPYRAPLIPEFAQLQKRLKHLPIIGSVISGAGSSILVIVNTNHKETVFNFLSDWSKTYPNSPQILDLQVDNKGIQELYD